MTNKIDATHDAGRRSWVASANGHAAFPIQNLPFGVFSAPGAGPRGGVAIGDGVLDLAAGLAAGLFTGAAEQAASAASGPTLNPFLALCAGPRRALRARLSELLADDAPASVRDLGSRLVRSAAECTMHVPAAIGDYSDFFAGIHHALNGGRLLRPDNPLMPNYKYLPVAYHGRSSSIVASGTPVRRPLGQRKPANAPEPTFGASRNLDYELELGIWIGPGNDLGAPVPIGQASEHVAGFCLLNDWSARDIQGFEYQPLGPFLAKSFCTTISPWIVTAEALAPFRRAQPPRPDGDPAVPAHLCDSNDQAEGALDIGLEVFLSTEAMREQKLAPFRLSAGNAQHLYWTVAQMVAHQTSAGCNLRPGDLFGSGTISTPEPDGWGSLLEISRGGRETVALPSGETRRFLEDGDRITLSATCTRDGFATIGFGPCTGTILPARVATQ